MVFGQSLHSLIRAGVAAVLLASATAALAKPNIVVILTDDQDDTGSMAYMPKVRSMIASQGITFTNSFVSFPTCSPSRASFFTGQSAHNHGIRSNSPDKGGGWETFKSKEESTLPVWLKRAGYKTALIGKYFNGYGEQKDAEPPGWDHWFAFARRAKYYKYKIDQDGRLEEYGRDPSDYSTDVLRDKAVDFIRKSSAEAEPFFLLVATKAPHRGGAKSDAATPAPRDADLFAQVTLPNLPAFNEKDLSDKPPWVRRTPDLGPQAKEHFEAVYRSRLQALQAVDDLVEAIVNALRDAGKLEDTYIIYTSDNGFVYGEHRLRGKVNVYEGSIRVPLVIRGPDVPHDQTRNQLVNNLDVVATIEQRAGVTPGLVPDGRALTPLFVDANAPWRSAIPIEGGHELASEEGRRGRKSQAAGAGEQSWLEWIKQKLRAYGLGSSGSGRLFYGVRTQTRKYVRYGDGFEELYDLEADPYELDNKAKDPGYASDLARLRGINDRLKSCTGDGCWVP
jgi:arylsulfatase A-like enzyme